MYHLFFAHAGEHHETAAEAAQHADQGLVLSTVALFWAALILIPLVLLLVMHVMRIKPTLQLLILSIFFIAYSVVSYQHPGIYSALALALGFTIVFIQSMIGLSAQES